MIFVVNKPAEILSLIETNRFANLNISLYMAIFNIKGKKYGQLRGNIERMIIDKLIPLDLIVAQTEWYKNKPKLLYAIFRYVQGSTAIIKESRIDRTRPSVYETHIDDFIDLYPELKDLDIPSEIRDTDKKKFVHSLHKQIFNGIFRAPRSSKPFYLFRFSNDNNPNYKPLSHHKVGEKVITNSILSTSYIYPYDFSVYGCCLYVFHVPPNFPVLFLNQEEHEILLPPHTVMKVSKFTVLNDISYNSFEINSYEEYKENSDILVTHFEIIGINDEIKKVDSPISESKNYKSNVKVTL